MYVCECHVVFLHPTVWDRWTRLRQCVLEAPVHLQSLARPAGQWRTCSSHPKEAESGGGLLLPQHRQGDARWSPEVHHHWGDALSPAGVCRPQCAQVRKRVEGRGGKVYTYIHTYIQWSLSVVDTTGQRKCVGVLIQYMYFGGWFVYTYVRTYTIGTSWLESWCPLRLYYVLVYVTT